jgi:putative restriction endonuclease
MNQALSIKQWKDGGNNYVLKGNPKNKWVGYQETVLSQLSKAFGDNFNIVIWTDEKNKDDYYCIPYSILKHLFTDEHKTTGKYPNRWTSIILEHRFLMHSNSQLSVDILSYYAKKLIPELTIELEDDFFIENAKAEINVRIGQSKFRKNVLRNFANKCALSGISDASLLTASHIIPWSDRKDFRGDISNGICLYVEYDAFFDKGFISFTDDLEIIVTSDTSKCSSQLFEKLNTLRGRILRQPLNKPINKDYLDYHRRIVFEQWKKNFTTRNWKELSIKT